VTADGTAALAAVTIGAVEVWRRAPGARFTSLGKAGSGAFDVSRNGLRLPPKSTFFLPKVPTGIVLDPIDTPAV